MITRQLVIFYSVIKVEQILNRIIMGLFGLCKGIVVKIVTGLVIGDGELIISGGKKTVINAVTTTVQMCAGELMNKAHIDDDEDD